MDKPLVALKKDLIAACKILSNEKLVHGFGHVSARVPGTNRLLITPRISLALVAENQLLTLDGDGKLVDGKYPIPFEAALHTAILKAKPHINAVVRIHAPVARMFSVTDRKLEPVHNHGSFFFGGVPIFPKTDLISTRELGEGVVSVLGDKPAVLLRGNGQVTIGRSVPEAVIMAIYLEEAAEILFGALQIGTPIPLTAEEAALRKVETLPAVDLERAWNYYKGKIAGRRST